MITACKAVNLNVFLVVRMKAPTKSCPNPQMLAESRSAHHQ